MLGKRSVRLMLVVWVAFAVFVSWVTGAAADDVASRVASTQVGSGVNGLSVRWTSLLPPLVAIGLAVVLRETLTALFAAVWTGMLLLSTSEAGWGWRLGESLIASIETLVEQLVPTDGDATHVQIILFTLFLGSVVSLMSASGGTQALVDRLTPVTRSRRGGQVTTCLLGVVIFFDDYANSLLLGSTLRPVTDRLRISREKLAFLVDATAAPIAGLAFVSTWVGFEVGLIGDSFARLAETNVGVTYSGDAYGTFLATLPYRFYPWLLLAFVLMVAWTGRDFGPMRAAEERAGKGEREVAPGANLQATDRDAGVTVEETVGTMWNAVVPLGVLLGGIVIGFWVTGRAGTDVETPSVWQVVSSADTNRVLVVSSFLASLAAGMMAVLTRCLSLQAAVGAWVEGAKSMLLAAAILVLAWAVAMVCDADHLNTAGYLVELTTGQLDVRWMPAVAFLLSGAVAFATGTSWATMGLLIPMIVNVTYGLMLDTPSLIGDMGVERHPLMLASVGSVLAGAIFGDHCSPISDTTVLSSVAADCDHLAHVWTQMPYAVCVAVITVVCGSIPVGFGVSWLFVLLLGVLACWLVVRFMGRKLDS